MAIGQRWRVIYTSYIYTDGAKTMLCSVCIACHYVVRYDNVSLEDIDHVCRYGGTMPVFSVGVAVVLVGQCVLVLALP